jgi:hypothetical protein
MTKNEALMKLKEYSNRKSRAVFSEALPQIGNEERDDNHADRLLLEGGFNSDELRELADIFDAISVGEQ